MPDPSAVTSRELILLGGGISFLQGLALFFIARFTSKLDKINERFEGKLDKTECRFEQSRCHEEVHQEQNELWSVLNGHSHTGLPEGSKVCR